MQTIRKLFRCVTAGALFTAAVGPGLSAQAGEPKGGPPAEVHAQEPGVLVVLSGTSAEALLLDPGQNRVLARFPTGPNPRGVAIGPDGRFAYVTSYGWRPAPGGRSTGSPGVTASLRVGATAPRSAAGVTVLDLERRRVHAVFQPNDYLNLGSIAVGEGGERLWVMSEAEQGIVELDARTGEVKMLWKTGSDAGFVAVSQDARRVFVSNTDADEITVIDRITVVPTVVPTGRRPTGLAFAPDRRELWVANSGENTISVIKGVRRPHEIARFSSGGVEPVRVSYNPERREMWVSHRGSRTVTVLDVASAAIVAEIPLPGEPLSITFADDGNHAYVSSPATNRVFVIDVESREMIGALDAGSRPSGIAWSRQGGS